MVIEKTHASTVSVYNSFTGDKIGIVPSREYEKYKNIY